ncbi:MAG: class I SAM-dependent methyltransferase [Segniliparus sp.]|uniref:class I SAM-dependent methyltransferase n=1 Tax=Segniliparus sp. TaxID=2804064 RepID=UPI003F41A504
MTSGDKAITEAYSANADFWVKVIRERRDKYQTDLVDRALLAAVGPCEGRVFLDAGCGEGYFSRMLAARGAARVHGVDSCPELVDAARSFAGEDASRTAYHLADAAALPLPDGAVDVVVANRLPHGLDDPGKRFHEFARVLRPGGLLVFLALHPCFYTARGAADPLSAQEYFAPRLVVQHFDVDGMVSPQPSVQRFFSLEEHTSFLFDAGFHIVGLCEPRPTQDQVARDQWWREHFTRPLFLLLSCRRDGAEGSRPGP